MKVPIDIIVERMKLYDQTEICDLLDISSEDLIYKFHDRIVKRRDYLQGELEIFADETTIEDSTVPDSDNYSSEFDDESSGFSTRDFDEDY